MLDKALIWHPIIMCKAYEPYQLCKNGQKDDNCGSVAGKLSETGHKCSDKHHSCGWRDLGQRLEVASDPGGEARLLPNTTRSREGGSKISLQHNQTNTSQMEQTITWSALVLNPVRPQEAFLRIGSRIWCVQWNCYLLNVKLHLLSFHYIWRLHWCYLAGFSHWKAATQQQNDVPGDSVLGFLPWQEGNIRGVGTWHRYGDRGTVSSTLTSPWSLWYGTWS